jgi:predicted secreted protein
MAVTYSLGKDATITGVANSSVRNVTATIEATQIDVTKRGDTTRKFKTGFKEASIEIEMLDSPPEGGDEISIVHANSGISGTFIVTSVSKAEPLDDVVTYNVQCKMKDSPSGS